MASVVAEYQRFLESLATRPVDGEILRMANLVYSNIFHLAQVGASRRARSTRLASIAIENLENTSTEIPVFNTMNADANNIVHLHELSVGPFRGFTNQEVFDLRAR